MHHSTRTLVICIAATVLLRVGLGRSVMADSAGVNLTLAGWVGGQVRPVSIEGTTAFIGVGPVVDMIDLSNPGTPTLAGAIRRLTQTYEPDS